MFGISHNRQQPVVYSDDVPEIECAIRSRPRGRQHIEQIERDPLRSRHTSRRRDAGMKEPMSRSQSSCSLGRDGVFHGHGSEIETSRAHFTETLRNVLATAHRACDGETISANGVRRIGPLSSIR